MSGDAGNRTRVQTISNKEHYARFPRQVEGAPSEILGPPKADHGFFSSDGNRATPSDKAPFLTSARAYEALDAADAPTCVRVNLLGLGSEVPLFTWPEAPRRAFLAPNRLSKPVRPRVALGLTFHKISIRSRAAHLHPRKARKIVRWVLCRTLRAEARPVSGERWSFALSALPDLTTLTKGRRPLGERPLTAHAFV